MFVNFSKKQGFSTVVGSNKQTIFALVACALINSNADVALSTNALSTGFTKIGWCTSILIQIVMLIASQLICKDTNYHGPAGSSAREQLRLLVIFFLEKQLFLETSSLRSTYLNSINYFLFTSALCIYVES